MPCRSLKQSNDLVNIANQTLARCLPARNERPGSGSRFRDGQDSQRTESGHEFAGLIKNVMEPPKDVLDQRRCWRLSGRSISELMAVDRSETHRAACRQGVNPHTLAHCRANFQARANLSLALDVYYRLPPPMPKIRTIVPSVIAQLPSILPNLVQVLADLASVLGDFGATRAVV
jgi:hypothetical protein